jgi:hypothetical protein
MFTKLDMTVVVPAPDEPVIAITGCLVDMQSSPGKAIVLAHVVVDLLALPARCSRREDQDCAHHLFRRRKRLRCPEEDDRVNGFVRSAHALASGRNSERSLNSGETKRLVFAAVEFAVVAFDALTSQREPRITGTRWCSCSGCLSRIAVASGRSQAAGLLDQHCHRIGFVHQAQAPPLFGALLSRG